MLAHIKHTYKANPHHDYDKPSLRSGSSTSRFGLSMSSSSLALARVALAQAYARKAHVQACTCSSLTQAATTNIYTSKYTQARPHPSLTPAPPRLRLGWAYVRQNRVCERTSARVARTSMHTTHECTYDMCKPTASTYAPRESSNALKKPFFPPLISGCFALNLTRNRLESGAGSFGAFRSPSDHHFEAPKALYGPFGATATRPYGS